MHAARPEHSPRLQRLLAVLADGREHTSRELQDAAATVAVGTCASELRAAGYDVTCRRRGKNVWTYQLRRLDDRRGRWAKPRLRAWREGEMPLRAHFALRDIARRTVGLRESQNRMALEIGARLPWPKQKTARWPL